jgi:hypothetical protein
MKVSHLVIAALSVAAATAYADDADRSGQFAQSVAAGTTRAQVEAQLSDYRKAGVNPWSISYNPLKGFKSERSAAEVQAEYLASRDAVAAMTAEDSGSAFLAASQPAADTRHFAGQPVNAQ